MGKPMRKLLAVLALLIAPIGIAQAMDITVSWTLPTKNVDGTAIAAAQAISFTRIEYGYCNGEAFGDFIGQVVVNVPATTTILKNLPNQIYCVRAYVTNVQSVQSDPSNVVKRGANTKPAPPVLSTVELTAYKVTIQQDKFSLAKVGTINERIACDPKQTVNGLYAVPRSRVKYNSTARPLIVVAKCRA